MPKKPAVKKSKKADQAERKKQVLVARSQNGLRLKKLTRKQRKQQSKKDAKLQKLPSAWKILIQSLQHLYRNKKLFLGILAVYGVLYILFVKGISANFQLGSLRENLETAFSGKMGGLSRGVTLYALLIGSSTSTSTDTGGVYQSFLIIVMSLALVWALRRTFKESPKLRVRDAFYKSMYPFVPFLIVCLIIVLQTMPALIATSIYTQVTSGGLASNSFQSFLFLVLLVLGLFWTFYMLTSSLFALYISTLPNSAPMAALKSAKKLVKYRRLVLLRKVLFLPFILLVASALILIPLIIFIPTAAEIVFMLCSILVLGVVHSYYYHLYRSML